MRIPWVLISRNEYELLYQRIEELKDSNTQLLTLALTKQAAPAKSEEEEEKQIPTRRRLVKEIREDAENQLRQKAIAAGKPKK